MEYEHVEQSANIAEVAEPQELDTQNTDVQETSENNSEVAEPNNVQDAATNAHYAEQRRNKEIEEYRTRVSEYEQNLNRVAQVAGYESHDQLLQAIEQAEKEQEQQKYRDAGIDPETFNSLLEQHPDIQYAREMKQKEEASQKFNAEANEFFSEFPDVKPEDIPAEVWELKDQKGLTLLDSYLRINYKSLGQQKEQEAIQKLQNNALASPGSLSEGDVKHTTSIKDMGKQDFESLLQRVKNGEVRSY